MRAIGFLMMKYLNILKLFSKLLTAHSKKGSTYKLVLLVYTISDLNPLYTLELHYEALRCNKD